jgi:hypothetical protein
MSDLAPFIQLACLAISTIGVFLLADTFLWPTSITRLERAAVAGLTAFTIPSIITLWILFFVPPDHVSILGASCITTLVVIVGLATTYRTSGRGGLSLARLNSRKIAARDYVSLAIIGSISLYQLTAAARKPVMAVDGLLYHGGTVALLIQNGSLWDWKPVSAYSFYPDLIALQAAQLFSVHLDTNWIDLVQPFYFFVLGTMVYAWLRRSTIPIFALGMTILLLGTPAIYAQTRFFYVDVAFAAIIVGAVLTGIQWSRSLDIRLLIVSLALLGASASVKPSGIVLLAPALVIVMVIALRHRRLTASLVAAVPFMLCSAPFYIRNLVDKHNPVYPLQLPGPLKILPSEIRVAELYAGLVPAPLEGLPSPLAFAANLWISAVSGSQVLNYDVRLGGFGYGAAALLALGSAVTIVALRRRKLPRLCIPPFLIAVILIVLQTEAWYPRYSIAAYTLLIVAVGLGACTLRPRRKISTALGFSLCVLGASMMFYLEGNMLGGIRDVQSWKNNATYNQGVYGWNPAYGDAYGWVSKAPCNSRVLIPESQLRGGLYGAYNFGLYGDDLCNSVRILAPGDDLTHVDWDYVVLPRSEDIGFDLPTCSSIVGIAPAIYGDEQVIMNNCNQR